MENDILISIIIPVYNVEKYLERCLNSVINQTYKNLEIILIDDGSTDGSGKICDEFTKKDNRIIVIHKENGGVSSARNKGLEIAQGEYIGFVDSDDYIEENMYEVLFENLVNFNVDISMCNYNILKNNKKTFHKHTMENGLLITENKKFLELLRLNYYKGFLYNKLFKAKMIKKMKLDVNIHICEDLLLIAQLTNQCKKYYFDNRCLYNYVIREDSAINGKINDKKFSVLDAYRKVIEIVKQYGNELTIKYEFDYFKWENDLIKQSGRKDESLEKESVLLFNTIMKSQYASFNEKLEVFIRYRMYGIYNIFRNLYHKILNLRKDNQ